MKLNGPIAVIIAALIGLAGIVIGSFLNPYMENLLDKPTPVPAPASLSIEQIPQQVFAFAGNGSPDGGWSAFWLYYEDEGIPVYKLEYYLPEEGNGYAGLAFEFMEGENLSMYSAVECILLFSQPGEMADLYFKDIAGHFNTIRASNNDSNELALRYEFTNYPEVNFNALYEFGLVVSTDFIRGSHQVRVKDIRFVK